MSKDDGTFEDITITNVKSILGTKESKVQPFEAKTVIPPLLMSINKNSVSPQTNYDNQ